MLAEWLMQETSPAAPGTGISANAIQDGVSLPFRAGVISSAALDDANVLSFRFLTQGNIGGTLDVCVQTSRDEGNSWDDQVRLATISAGDAPKYQTCTLTRGTSQTLTTIGSCVDGATPVLGLAAGNIVNGNWGNKIRLVMQSNASTSAGAPVQVQVTASRTTARMNG